MILFSPQNLSQTHMLIDLIQEVKDKCYKLRISPTIDTSVVQSAVHLFYFLSYSGVYLGFRCKLTHTLNFTFW